MELHVTVVGKFKDFFGATLLRFRSPQASLLAQRRFDTQDPGKN
jgi:hypothetical protein